MTIVRLDGIPIQIIKPDIDGDGQTGGIERPMYNPSEGTPIVQATELGEAIRELNDDTINPESRMSNVDFKARLHYAELPSVLAMDALVAFKALPPLCLAFTRQKKRLSVSLGGKGREEMVSMVHGKKEQDIKIGGGGFMDKIRNFGSGGQS